jgi:large subunit ribosomal protein L22
MNVPAHAKYVRQSSLKVRRVLDIVRGLPAEEAVIVLNHTDRKAAGTIQKVLESAIANARENFDIPSEDLVVAQAYANEGPTLKRWRPRARGRATQILKRTCHITIVVSNGEEG